MTRKYEFTLKIAVPVRSAELEGWMGRLAEIIRNAGTVIWNGPVGVFEFESFHAGTQAIAHAVAGCKGFTLAGGGDTIAAIEKYHVADRIDYISTAGGAFLEYVEGKELPALAALEN